MLRYHVDGFEGLSLKYKEFIYCLSEAALSGRDILFDQNGAYNLRIRRTLEAIYTHSSSNRSSENFLAMEIYLKRIWFSSGIHHHYGCEKFIPEFTKDFLKQEMLSIDAKLLPLQEGESAEELFELLDPIIFDPEIMPKRVNKSQGEDILTTSA